MEKEHEPRKLFVGGLPRLGISPANLRAHFARYGHVVDALVLTYPDGVGRGFGFVEFQDEAAVLRALDAGERDRHNAFFGRRVEVKRAERKPEVMYAQTLTQAITYGSNAELRKVFVGGLRDKVTTEQQLMDYFKSFGTITDVVVMYDKFTQKPRGFGFVTFDSQEATDKVLQDRYHYLNGTKVEVKNAEPRGSKYRNGHYHATSLAIDYGGALYSPYYVPQLYPYYVPYTYGPHGIYMSQSDTFDAVGSESNSKLIHNNENKQKNFIPTPVGMKSDPVKQDSNNLL